MFDNSEDDGLGAGGEEREAPGRDDHHPGPGPLLDGVDGGEGPGDADVPRVRRSHSLLRPDRQASPVNAEDHQQVGAEDVAATPHHHQRPAQPRPSVPLNPVSKYRHNVIRLTPMQIFQMVSMGRVMKQVMVSARVRWNTM